MNDYYIRYKKTSIAKYVSHLDFVRMFGRAMRRAKLPTVYSQGFNPHQLLGFALPLSVGYTSECEIMEFKLEEEINCEEIKERLNSVLPQGVEIINVFEGKSRMKTLDSALYIITPEIMPDSLCEFINNESIIIDKKTKSGVKETDIKKDIRKIEIVSDHIETILSAGSKANLKPEVVVKALNKYISNFESGDCEYHRKKLFDENFAEI